MLYEHFTSYTDLITIFLRFCNRPRVCLLIFNKIVKNFIDQVVVITITVCHDLSTPENQHSSSESTLDLSLWKSSCMHTTRFIHTYARVGPGGPGEPGGPDCFWQPKAVPRTTFYPGPIFSLQRHKLYDSGKGLSELDIGTFGKYSNINQNIHDV